METITKAVNTDVDSINKKKTPIGDGNSIPLACSYLLRNINKKKTPTGDGNIKCLKVKHHR